MTYTDDCARLEQKGREWARAVLTVESPRKTFELACWRVQIYLPILFVFVWPPSSKFREDVRTARYPDQAENRAFLAGVVAEIEEQTK